MHGSRGNGIYICSIHVHHSDINVRDHPPLLTAVFGFLGLAFRFWDYFQLAGWCIVHLFTWYSHTLQAERGKLWSGNAACSQATTLSKTPLPQQFTLALESGIVILWTQFIQYSPNHSKEWQDLSILSVCLSSHTDWNRLIVIFSSCDNTQKLQCQ